MPDPGGLMTLDEAALKRIVAAVHAQVTQTQAHNTEETSTKAAEKAILTFFQRLGYEEDDFAELRKDLAHAKFSREFKETMVKQTINATVWFIVIGILGAIGWFIKGGVPMK